MQRPFYPSGVPIPPPGLPPPPPPPFYGGGRGLPMMPPPPPPPPTAAYGANYHYNQHQPHLPYQNHLQYPQQHQYDPAAFAQQQYANEYNFSNETVAAEPEKDPFIEEFEKKFESHMKMMNQLEDNVDWAPLQMKIRAKRILVALDRIAEIDTEIELVKQKSANSTEKSPASSLLTTLKEKRLIQLQTESTLLRRQVELDMAPFRNKELFQAFQERILAKERKARKKRKRNEDLKARRKEDERLRGTIHRLVDEWLASEAANVEQKEIDEEKKQREQARTVRKETKERQRRELAILIVKLEQLRRVRMQRNMTMKSDIDLNEDYSDNIDRDYYSIVKQLIPDQDDAEEGQTATEQPEIVVPTTAAAESTAAAVAAAARDADLPDSDEEDEDEDGKVKLEDLDAEFNEPLHFYYQAYESLDDLINRRRQWDSFLCAPRTGSRIPNTFIAPPDPPMSEVWAQYIVRKPSDATGDQMDVEPGGTS